MRELLEKTRTGKWAIWQGFFRDSNKQARVVVPVKKSKIIYRKTIAKIGRHCLSVLNDKDYVLTLYSNGEIKLASVQRFDAKRGEFYEAKVFFGSDERVIKELLSFLGDDRKELINTVFEALYLGRCPHWGTPVQKVTEICLEKEQIKGEEK